MINNPDWYKPKNKQHIYQISSECLKKLVECMENFDIGEIDGNACFKFNKQSLTDEIVDTEFLAFAIRNLSELFACIASGRTNIRIHRDSTGRMWFVVG